MAESLPTSVSAFNHRRARADSTASFTYYQDEPGLSSDEVAFDEDYPSDGVGELRFGEEDDESVNVESRRQSEDYILHRRSSTYSRSSVHDRLLRTDSARTGESGRGQGRQSQKVYMINEDLTIAIAGFQTSPFGFFLYVLLCVCTLGLAWLPLRWLPRWHVRLLGRPSPLRECDWVVIEVNRGTMSARS